MVEALTKPLNLVTQSVTGNFTQTATGRLLIDIALLAPEGAPRNDLLTVTGTASLGGVVEPNIVSGLLPGRYIFLEAGQVTDVTATTTDGTLHSGAVPISWALVFTGDSIALTSAGAFHVARGHDAHLRPAQRRARPAGRVGRKHRQARQRLRPLRF